MYACLYAPGLEEERGGLLVNCAYGFSPRVEETDARTVVVAIDGLERLLGPPEQMARAMVRRAAELGMEVRVAVAAIRAWCSTGCSCRQHRSRKSWS